MTWLYVLTAIVGVIVIPYLLFVVLYHVLRLVFLLVARLVAMLGGFALDVVHLAGHIIGAALHVPLVLLSLIFFRFGEASEKCAALGAELAGVGRSIFSGLILRPLRFLGLVRSEKEAKLANVPAEDADGFDFDRELEPTAKKAAGHDEFEGYKVVGDLPRGGSGARLFVAEPVGEKVATLARIAGAPIDRVVIKAFSLDDGSTMPQIVRESRALEAARDLGLVFEHSLDGARFHYVMPYVPGDDLATVTRDLHHDSGTGGLNARSMRAALTYFSELLVTVERFHHKGLWHKDIKPSNVIVSEGRVHLVDLGLVTPLRSAMTLTTHGTEYFRDPEMVRLAMQGVKVHEVDGVKFDLYSAGALLYSMLENSFPAHGSLSRFSLKVPQSLQWIVRRAMADMGKRYASAGEMLADLETVLGSPNPFGLKPGDLPSMQGRKLHFKSWQAGAAGAAFRSHGYGESTRFGRQSGSFERRINEIGDRLTGVGERVQGRVKRARRNVNSKVHQRTSRMSSKVHARASRSRRWGLSPAIALVLLLACGTVGLLGMSIERSPELPSMRVVKTWGDPQPATEFVSHTVSFGKGGPSVARRVSNQNRIDHEVELLQQALEVNVLTKVTPGAEWEVLREMGEDSKVLFLNDLSSFRSVEFEQALRDLPFELVGLGSAESEIEALAGALTTIEFAEPDDTQAIGYLGEFLKRQDKIDAVYWLGLSNDGEDVLGRVVSRP